MILLKPEDFNWRVLIFDAKIQSIIQIDTRSRKNWTMTAILSKSSDMSEYYFLKLLITLLLVKLAVLG